jgi:hypothetical protein
VLTARSRGHYVQVDSLVSPVSDAGRGTVRLTTKTTASHLTLDGSAYPVIEVGIGR